MSPENAVHQAKAGPEDGHHGKLLARQRRRVHLADRRFDVLGGHGQVAGCLVGDEHADLTDQLAEILDAGVLVAHDGELVRYQRMIHNVDMGAKIVFLHPVTLLFRPLFCFCFLQSRAFGLRQPEVVRHKACGIAVLSPSDFLPRGKRHTGCALLAQMLRQQRQLR